MLVWYVYAVRTIPAQSPVCDAVYHVIASSVGVLRPLTIFAAASLRDAFTEIGQSYHAQHSDINCLLQL